MLLLTQYVFVHIHICAEYLQIQRDKKETGDLSMEVASTSIFSGFHIFASINFSIFSMARRVRWCSIYFSRKRKDKGNAVIAQLISNAQFHNKINNDSDDKRYSSTRLSTTSTTLESTTNWKHTFNLNYAHFLNHT